MALIRTVYQGGLAALPKFPSHSRNDHVSSPLFWRRSRQHDAPTMSVCGHGISQYRISQSRQRRSLLSPSCSNLNSDTSSEADSSSDVTSSSTIDYRNGYYSPSSPSQRTDIEIVESLHGIEELVTNAASSSDDAISDGLVRSPGLDEDSLAKVLSSASVVEVGSTSGLSTASVAGRVVVSQIVDKIAGVIDTKEAGEAIEDGGRRGDWSELPLAAEGGVKSGEAVQSLPLPETRVKENPTMLQQMRTILDFAGPALGIWLSNPLMSLIDTAVIGNSSSLELAALGPGTVVCDQIGFVFLFLAMATSNLIATSMALDDVDGAAAHLSRLLFVALACGFGMIAFTHFLATPIISRFVGTNVSLIPAARLYAGIRGLAWPAVLVTSVAQSASLGLQDAWGPLYVLAVASAINLSGDIVLCSFMGMGIAGAAWATMASQYVGCFLMLYTIWKAKKIRLSISVPSLNDLLMFVKLAGPILLTMLSKNFFYTLLTFVATSLGNTCVAAHQVSIGLFALCAVCGEPLSQTAQSFIPGLTTGKDRNLPQARTLLRALLTLGAGMGIVVGGATATIPWLAPHLFTRDPVIVGQMRQLTAPLYSSLLLTPLVLSLEGTLLAGRDLGYLAGMMMTSLVGCCCFVLLGQRMGMGLVANWWSLVVFQFVRLVLAALRLTSSHSLLADDPVKAAA